MLNINYGRNRELLEACRPLREYAWLMQKIREGREKYDLEAAVDKAIQEMPSEFILKPFLDAHRAEVKEPAAHGI